MLKTAGSVGEALFDSGGPLMAQSGSPDHNSKFDLAQSGRRGGEMWLLRTIESDGGFRETDRLISGVDS
jgi:hypothetical protein